MNKHYIIYIFSFSKDDPGDCVTRTYRLLRQKINRENLYEYIREKERDQKLPDSSREIICSLMKSPKGCRALLNYIRKENLSLFYEVMKKYKLKKDGKIG